MTTFFTPSSFPSPMHRLFPAPPNVQSTESFFESLHRTASTASSMVTPPRSSCDADDDEGCQIDEELGCSSFCHEYRPFLRHVINDEDIHHNAGTSLELKDLNHEQCFQDLQSTPIFSSAVKQQFLDTSRMNQRETIDPLPQFGLLGLRKKTTANATVEAGGAVQANLLFSNTQAPWSAFICGAQGSGKSHTLSCLLENAMLQSKELGNLPNPLTGLVFHWDKFSSFNSTQVCEAAYLCSAGIPVKVLVAPTSLTTMTHLYTNLAGLPEGSPRPQVMPMYLEEDQLNIENMMTLMAVHDAGEGAPLYISAIRNLLRQMALENQNRPGLDYQNFRTRIAALHLTDHQIQPLNLRLSLIESMLANPRLEGEPARPTWRFEEGSLTIVDLSDSFVSETDACALFNICLKIFMNSRSDSGRVIALDEAHKFLGQSQDARELTDALISIVRQQRHLGARVIVSTQEPTLSPQFLDLCNVSIVHRFNSPAWYTVLRDHLAGAKTAETMDQKLFHTILGLTTGEALVFCPTAICEVDIDGQPVFLKDKYEQVTIRKRITTDGGRSIMASDKNVVPIDRAEVKQSIVPWNVANPESTRLTRSAARKLEQAIPTTRPASPILINARVRKGYSNGAISHSLLKETAESMVFEMLSKSNEPINFDLRMWRTSLCNKFGLPSNYLDMDSFKNRCKDIFKAVVRKYYSDLIEAGNTSTIPKAAKSLIGID